MKSVLLVNASPQGPASRAYGMARKATDNLLSTEPDIRLVERHLSANSPSPISGAYADAIVQRARRETPAFVESETFIQDVIGCDYLIIATPMHNFTVPASLKLWIDYVLRDERTFTRRDGYKVGLLADRPALVIVGSGGMHNGPHARQPDYLSPYLTHVLTTIGISSVAFIYLQGMARQDAAEQSLVSADRQLAANPVFGLVSAVAGS
ncbi:FMN-dependent NADH-azoreductase [Rhizobium lusitanum]|uniref:FMN dependent NADH:quinone oxidoreductase n=1 Tax=Rhizobium lusitanum TaxID=293958 RepID=A0A7X0MBK6_9HYPH|nr:NAD(P)H-dependent oxidoreductase [Rhizobium lusitanum]MBB6482993.1 FMN-dependent NADH-azoreductase [Rhizobium lusitanum]